MSLTFRLVGEDGWPPFPTECIPVSRVGGGYQVNAAPFFVRNLSCKDVISPVFEDEEVVSFEHIERSGRSTVWVMAFDHAAVQKALRPLLQCGCNVEELPSISFMTIDVPEGCGLKEVDAALHSLTDDQAGVAFPSLRHAE